ncbi:MAG: alpha/beta hydrolase [Actinomycetes bacterium]
MSETPETVEYVPDPEIPIFDPQVEYLLQEIAASGAAPVETLTPEAAREAYAKTCKEQFGPVDEVHSVEDRVIEDVPVRIYRPVETSEPSRALVYVHGGGWVVGSIETHDGITRALAKRAGVVVISIDYRLAPEHPFPTALVDCWTVARWVWEHAEELGLDQERIGIAGDSAGAAIASAIVRKGREAATPFAMQVLLYPVLNHDFTTPSWKKFATGCGLTADAMKWYWEQYAGTAENLTDIDLAPGQLRDMRRLPPTLVVTAEYDILRDEAETFAQRLDLAGVPTEGFRYDGMIHGFLRMAGRVDRSQQALTEIAETIKVGLEPGWRVSFGG